MGQFRDFLNMLAGRPTEAQRKALNIQLAPNGFVNEVMTTIVGGASSWHGSAAESVGTDTLQRIMALNELVYACVQVKATAARDPKLIVQRQTTKAGKVEYEEIAGHPFRQLIMRPNPRMTESDLMAAAFVSWDVSNPRRFYCEKVYKAGRLTELWPLNPAQMTPRMSADRAEVIGYRWSDGRRAVDFTLDDLLIRSSPSWYDPPPMVAALGSAESDSGQTEYISNFFANGGVPSVILKYHNAALNDEQRRDIRAKWKSIHGSVRNSGEVGIADMNTDVQTIGSRLDQLASQTLRSIAESRICMVFGVPPLIVYAYVGLLRATYSNLKEAWAGFWDATMSPSLKGWRDFFTWALLVEFEDEAVIRSEAIRLNYDMGQVAALADDVTEIQKRARENYAAGIISQNEGRAALGYPPVPDGDTTYARSAAPAVPFKGRKSVDDPSVQAIERRIEKSVQQYLEDEYKAAAAAVS